MKLLLGTEKVEEQALKQMQTRGGEWAAYQNHELGNRDLGDLRFLQVGESCTFKTPPAKYPDTQYGIGWRYLFVGMVDLKTGEIKEK